MDEATWRACADPVRMLESLWGRASDRKLRLLAVASCRRLWDLLTDERSRRSVEAAERYADGLAGPAELEAARDAARAARLEGWSRRRAELSAGQEAAVDATEPEAGEAARAVTLGVAWRADLLAWDPRRRGRGGARASPRPDVWGAQAALLRELFGPSPFRPLALSPAWLTPAVVSLARAAYDERDLPSGYLDSARLAVLADALEEAGCTDADILGHLRGPGPHVRGCFAVDALLEKS